MTGTSSTRPRAAVDEHDPVELDAGRRRRGAQPEAVGAERALVAVVRGQHRRDPGRDRAGQVGVGRRRRSCVVQPGGVDGRVAELVGRGEHPQEADVGGEAEHGGLVERRDQRAARRLAVAAVGDHLAQHRVVRRGDDLPALEGVRRPARPRGQRTSVAVPACGRNPPKESSA